MTPAPSSNVRAVVLVCESLVRANSDPRRLRYPSLSFASSRPSRGAVSCATVSRIPGVFALMRSRVMPNDRVPVSDGRTAIFLCPTTRRGPVCTGGDFVHSRARVPQRCTRSGRRRWGFRMDRVVNVARGHDEARRWDVEQQRSMTPRARLRAARELKDRAYPDAPDVREWHRSR